MLNKNTADSRQGVIPNFGRWTGNKQFIVAKQYTGTQKDPVALCQKRKTNFTSNTPRIRAIKSRLLRRVGQEAHMTHT
jgi:hypothetical protein